MSAISDPTKSSNVVPLNPGKGCRRVAIIMGSTSDWPTMREAARVLDAAGIERTASVVSAHRTPKLLYDFATRAQDEGYFCIIAGAGGAAHLPGMAAALTELPVLGVPVRSRALDGVDSLLSIVQMPSGIPVATFKVGAAGAVQAAQFAVRMYNALHLDQPSAK